MKNIVVIFLNILTLSHCLNSELIFDFFVNIKPVQHIVIFTCYNSINDIQNLSKKLSNENILTTFTFENQKFPIIEILDTRIFAQCGIVVDFSWCDDDDDDEQGYERVLTEASNNRYFNQSYIWLIFDDGHDSGIDRILGPIPNIGINTEVTFVMNQKNETSSNYDLVDVYSQGRHLGLPLVTQKYGLWNIDDGILINYVFPTKYQRNYRGDFKGVTLRGVTVIDRDNIFDKDVDPLLSDPTPAFGISPLVKYHYALTLFSKYKYNFNVKYRIARGWGGRLKSGYRLGLLGIAQRGEVDIVASGAFTRLNRHDEFDFIHHSWKFMAGFIFVLTPDIISSEESGSFLDPFTDIVWIVITISSIMIIMIFFFFDRIYQTLRNGYKASLMLNFLHTVAALCQQGIEPIQYYFPIRVIVFTLMLNSLLLYNFYTSSVVGSLLSTIPKGPSTINEIIDSPLTLSFEDIGFHKILFQESNDSIVKKMITKKVTPQRDNSSTIPVYTTLKNAIPYVKKGGFAFHSETAAAYPVIAQAFDANEICDLRIVMGLLETEVLGMIQPKRNMYSEMFKITMIRSQEVGFIDRTLKIHQPQRPVCQSSSTVHPVTLLSVTAAFKILGLSYVLSVIVLLLEIIYYKWRRDRKDSSSTPSLSSSHD